METSFEVIIALTETEHKMVLNHLFIFFYLEEVRYKKKAFNLTNLTNI